VTGRADFDRLIAELSSARCEQDAQVILQANKAVLDWMASLPTQQCGELTGQLQDVMAELPEQE
jgi:hypothetical protein